MTPLAGWMAKQLTLPTRNRDDEFKGFDPLVVSDALNDIHCFEITQVLGLLPEVVQHLAKLDDDSNEKIIGKFAFLPAPKTWIEYLDADPEVGRIALLLQQEEIEPPSATVDILVRYGGSRLGRISTSTADYQIIGGEKHVPTALINRYGEQRVLDVLMSTCHLALLLINSPRIIGRKQFMPHRGLERKLIKQFGVGKFPLHAWTEIVLRVNKPVEIDDGEPHEAHLTGTRALHFVRKHIRIRLGRLEYVSAHWRGDAALGIKRSRYEVAP